MMDALKAHQAVCPMCGSGDVRVFEYDFGVCSQTGYSNSGERFECSRCGTSGESDELLACAESDAVLGGVEDSATRAAGAL
jgi:hypothetical protein